MLASQLQARGIKNPRVLEVMDSVPRELFVPPRYRYAAYEDNALPIGFEQTISQPYIVALMTETAELQSTHRVLEIGTGSGYQTAILSKLVKEVYTIEIIEQLSNQAAKVFKLLKLNNIFAKMGDGYQGWAEKAPFDSIIVTAAPETVPVTLVSQLTEGGKLIIPIGKESQELKKITKTKDGSQEERLLSVKFVPLVKSFRKTN